MAEEKKCPIHSIVGGFRVEFRLKLFSVVNRHIKEEEKQTTEAIAK